MLSHNLQIRLMICRCKVWIQQSGNSSLLTINPVDLHKTAFLCKEHFDNNCLLIDNSQALKSDAVPTIFTCQPLSDEVVSTYGINMPIPGNYDVF